MSAACGDDADRTDTAVQRVALDRPATSASGVGTETSDTVVAPAATPSASGATEAVDGVIDIGGGRTLYVRCTGSGSPTVILEGGDEDTSGSYAFAEATLADVTRTCVYDRANLGRSGPAPGPRGLEDLVSDLERLVEVAAIPSPYVLVGTSGGGYITIGYAVEHPDLVAGMVFVETAAPFVDPPPKVIEETAWDHPSNVERRDYLQIERDAWAALAEIGDIPVTVISNDYGPEAEFEGERTNVRDQQALTSLSRRTEQVVVRTGHAVEEQDPLLVVDAIIGVVTAAR